MGLEIVSGRIPDPASKREAHAAAVHLADRVAAENPTPLDDLMPRLAGRHLAEQPEVRDQLLELLDQLGLTTTRGTRNA
jgi:hypothetical protein